MIKTPFDHQGVLTSVTRLASDTIGLKVKLTEPGSMKFTAGQFVNIQAGEKLFRPYSISSSPSQTGELEFVIKLVEGGKASAWFAMVKVGDVMHLKGPFGKFVVSPETDRTDVRNRFVFVATGTGLAPILSQLKSLFEENNSVSKTLYFGMYDTDRYLCRALLEGWTKQHSEFQVIPVMSNQPADQAWEGRRGYVTTYVEQDITDVVGLDAYICGNPLMIAAVKPIFLAKGLPLQHIHEERF